MVQILLMLEELFTQDSKMEDLFCSPSQLESLDRTCTMYKMEISSEKTKLMTNSASGIQGEIKVK